MGVVDRSKQPTIARRRPKSNEAIVMENTMSSQLHTSSFETMMNHVVLNQL